MSDDLKAWRKWYNESDVKKWSAYANQLVKTVHKERAEKQSMAQQLSHLRGIVHSQTYLEGYELAKQQLHDAEAGVWHDNSISNVGQGSYPVI